MKHAILLALLCLTGCGQFPVGLAFPRDTRPAAVVAIEDARLQYQRERFPVLPDTLGGGGTNGRGASPEVAATIVQFLLITDPDTCIPCVKVEADTLPVLRDREHWVIDHTANATIRIISPQDAAWDQALKDWRVKEIPMLCPLVNGVGKRSNCVTGFQTADQVLALYRKHSGPQSYQAGPQAFGAGANTRLASDWLTLPGLSLSLAQAALRVDSAQTLRMNEHFAVEFKPGCQITPAADRITLTAPYPVVRVKYLFSLEAALTGIKLDTAGRKATFELSGFPDKTFSF